jgi:hypothetical protein
MMIRTTEKPPAPTTRPLTEKEAVALTGRIRKAVDNLWALLLEAHDRRAWKALKYATWEAYVAAEFSMSRTRSYQILDQGRVIEAIRQVTGDLSTAGRQSEKGRGGTRTLSAVDLNVDISERDARDIKDDLAAVTAEISTRVGQGEPPQKAATDVIAEKRAAKASTKIENERQRDEHRAALPDAIKQRDQAKTDAIAKRKEGAGRQWVDDRVAELEEEVRVLDAENASYRAEIAKFGPMRVQFEQGGFEKVVADKDEVIRTLETRLYSESADKASWMKNAKRWQAEAKKLGWSGTVTIDIEAGEPANG